MKASHAREAMALARSGAMENQRVLPLNAQENITSFDRGSSCRRSARRTAASALPDDRARARDDHQRTDADQSWKLFSERRREPSAPPIDHDILFVVITTSSLS
jgi:hypothetical protein